MDPAVAAALQSWTFEPWLVFPLVLSAVVYVRGWLDVRRQMPSRFPPWRCFCFLLGLSVVIVAATSPLDAFAGLLLQVHMTQHLLLTMVAPPLVWLGAPAIPLLRGLPNVARKDLLGPFLAWPGLQRIGQRVSHPIVCWLAFVGAMWFWHVPALYELALRSRFWHQVEHISFLTTALLFWWPVLQPWPSAPVWPRWAMIPYLLFADVQNTIFSGFLAFSERVIYPTYATAPRLGSLSALDDQAAAAALMWVPGSIVFLLPLVSIISELLNPRVVAAHPVSVPNATYGGTTRTESARWDLLAAPGVGSLLRWPHFRRIAQAVMLSLAVLIIGDGLLGPQMSPMNLAGVLPWTYWRGFAVIALLAAGNLFCMACPFMVPRDLARRWWQPRWRWPHALRSKWLAIGIILVYLWAYEALSLWDSPWWTAWIVVSYFGAAIVVDGLFRGASFCKYVCPIGQFHFVQSLVSPLEVAVRDTDVCRTCTSYDCIRGNAHERGCELLLFQPKKHGNFDCTFCLDCVHACPHANVGILAVAPGRDLIANGYRSSVGRWTHRPDIAALALVLVVGAFVNAAGMLGPVVTWVNGLGVGGRAASLQLSVGTLLLIALVLAVPAIAGLCGAITRVLGRVRGSWIAVTSHFALSLIPVGLAMWCAHFAFHLGAGLSSAVPVFQRVGGDLGLVRLGSPVWSMGAMNTAAEGLRIMQIMLLDGGLLLSLYVGWRIAQVHAGRLRPALGALLPWASVATALYVVGIWIVFQPMQMRGTMMH